MKLLRRRHPTPEASFNPRRLSNLRRARLRVAQQLDNPNLSPVHRPQIERRLASITEEIESLERERI